MIFFGNQFVDDLKDEFATTIIISQLLQRYLAKYTATMNVSIFVTGSNSTLLSGDLATLLTGRTVEFEVFPFFLEMKQYLEMNNQEFNEDMIYEYIKWGGFPLRFEFHDEFLSACKQGHN